MANKLIQLTKKINLSSKKIDVSAFAKYEAQRIDFSSYEMCDCDTDCGDCEGPIYACDDKNESRYMKNKIKS